MNENYNQLIASTGFNMALKNYMNYYVHAVQVLYV